ncbi:MAG: hypothetical protein H8D78_03695 [Chloroflexi bacterium]|nr:hypothetical protein [Chloroflexota bacterium]
MSEQYRLVRVSDEYRLIGTGELTQLLDEKKATLRRELYELQIEGFAETIPTVRTSLEFKDAGTDGTGAQTLTAL